MLSVRCDSIEHRRPHGFSTRFDREDQHSFVQMGPPVCLQPPQSSNHSTNSVRRTAACIRNPMKTQRGPGPHDVASKATTPATCIHPNVKMPAHLLTRRPSRQLAAIYRPLGDNIHILTDRARGAPCPLSLSVSLSLSLSVSVHIAMKVQDSWQQTNGCRIGVQTEEQSISSPD